MVAARGAEESTSWRQPVDLVALCDEAASQLPELFAAGRRKRGWSDHTALAGELLGDDPANIIDALKAAILAGAAPSDLGRSLAYGAALRVARFGNANEHADWETAHHVFTYANALDQLIKRIGTDSDSDVTVVRGVLHGAMALYLTRYLNVPPARIPGEGGEQLDDLPTDPEAIRAALLDAFDRQTTGRSGGKAGSAAFSARPFWPARACASDRPHPEIDLREKAGSPDPRRGKAADNGGLRYGAMESALRPPLPTATRALADIKFKPP